MKPIIFNSEMVRAILDEKKTQTRRVIKPQPKAVLSQLENSNLWTYTLCEKEWKCPYGKVGDKLWVRETWANCKGLGIVDENENPAEIIYRADEPWAEEWKGNWKPSIFMPHCYTRITLEITNIRVERVQDITEYDAKAEGVKEFPKDFKEQLYYKCFRDLWNP